ncbi:MAG: glycoside hydrolase 43 family protein [Lachnospiraceae bacterium]|nr:glycoside hydrolase 43 family protein [Lachnospiraceae bacterium]
MKPILGIDCPDNDVVRVDDTYYMVSTSMYFFPGCEIMKSKDLENWEHASFVYDELDGTDDQKLCGDGNIYGKGMWAASFRHHNGIFYIAFVCNDTHKTYLFTSEKIEGPWKKSYIDGFFHDCSLLFDDDGKVYIAYGNRDIYITELNADLTGPKEGGLHRLAVQDSKKAPLGYEGTHFYKINGKYYLLFIHSLEDRWFRAESCFVSDSVDGEFTGKDVFVDDAGWFGSGIAQGAMFDSPEGDWYAMLFQDRGASGRIPYVLPVTWDGDFPVFGNNGKMPESFKLPRQDYGKIFAPFVGSDDFMTVYDKDSCYGFKNIWQFNHQPDMKLISRNTESGIYSVTTDKVTNSLTQAKNVLTQRMHEMQCEAEITVLGGQLKDGDVAGIAALQYLYGFIGITCSENTYEIVYIEREEENRTEIVRKVDITPSPAVRFKISVDFSGRKDEASFYYDCGLGWKKIEYTKNLKFRLEHFTGNRFGLVMFSTKTKGGKASFGNFVYRYQNG